MQYWHCLLSCFWYVQLRSLNSNFHFCTLLHSKLKAQMESVHRVTTGSCKEEEEEWPACQHPLIEERNVFHLDIKNQPLVSAVVQKWLASMYFTHEGEQMNKARMKGGWLERAGTSIILLQLHPDNFHSSVILYFVPMTNSLDLLMWKVRAIKEQGAFTLLAVTIMQHQLQSRCVEGFNSAWRWIVPDTPRTGGGPGEPLICLKRPSSSLPSHSQQDVSKAFKLGGVHSSPRLINGQIRVAS